MLQVFDIYNIVRVPLGLKTPVLFACSFFAYKKSTGPQLVKYEGHETQILAPFLTIEIKIIVDGIWRPRKGDTKHCRLLLAVSGRRFCTSSWFPAPTG